VVAWLRQPSAPSPCPRLADPVGAAGINLGINLRGSQANSEQLEPL